MNIEINNSGINDNFSLPIDGLSPCIQEIIQAYADGYQCERDFVVASVFAAVSTAIITAGNGLVVTTVTRLILHQMCFIKKI